MCVTLSNQILAALPPEGYRRIAPYLEYVNLAVGEVLYEAYEPIQKVYFPSKSMISLVSVMLDGSTTEIGLVGSEGVLGLPIFLGGKFTSNIAIVQIAGDAWKLNADLLKREFDRGGVLQQTLLLYTQALFTQVSQNAVCNRRHVIEKRLARWLLSVRDCIKQNELLLTQEFIATMLGTRRSGVTVAARKLQQAGLIRYSRGKITILDRQGLEASACECYGVVQREFERLLGSGKTTLS
ncbi:cAMP-binding protein - catabolite activator and regulatory subunit of cAMP-dependent protein kinase [Geitlerinema sp. FC II]|nr:Crp/Fnr family transcriptional regulator [Geitlerinema sp. CS-897]PPT08026.1 cAMP-binding protein - catabolite activator and regulatory subunit of cAMP-dependent protein kinase [Geitlerinema sp. FC II]